MDSPDHSPPPVGVVLVNLGTPDAPTLPAVRRYLRQFLLDRRIVDLNPVLWRIILETRIMYGHAKQSTTKYASIWLPDGSPLYLHTQALTSALAEATGLVVTCGMRYGQPALGTTLADLQRSGIDRVLLVPLFPQFSTTTTATIIDALSTYLRHSYQPPEVRWVRSWPTDRGYIEACADQIESHWAQIGRPDFAGGAKLLLSYHGIPEKLVQAGDPYPSQCQATTDALRARLELGPEHCLMTYQSKFGRGQWLTPATIDTVARLGELQTKRLDVFCPGFITDCLETLEELGQLNRHQFTSHGGGDFQLIPCLNSSAEWVEALAGLVRSHTQGWLP